MGIISNNDTEDDTPYPPKEQKEDIEFVRKKLIAIGYDRKLNKEDFEKYTLILATKDNLIKSYLHTDFEQAKRLQNEINLALGEETEKNFVIPGKKMENRDKNGVKIEYIDSCEEDTVEQVSGNFRDAELDDFHNPYHNLRGKIRIKLIISEISKTKLEQNLKRIISPFINLTFPNPPEFGLFHIALAIGPWKIEWNNSSLCIPRCINGRFSMICADLSEIDTLSKLEETRDKVADVVIKWNTKYTYTSQGGKLNQMHGNCQEFIEEILEKLNISVEKFSKPLQRYTKDLRVKGMCKMTFHMEEDFKKSFNQNKNSITFETHSQLDEFVRELEEINVDFSFKFREEYQFLKSFDRAFWMRYIKFEKSDLSEKEKNEKEKYAPHKKGCPFSHPIETSLMRLTPKQI